MKYLEEINNKKSRTMYSRILQIRHTEFPKFSIVNMPFGMVVIVLILVFLFACCGKDKDFVNTQMGFSFKRCTQHNSTPKAKVGDVIYGQMKILLNNKTIVSNNYGTPSRLFTIKKPKVGSIDEFLLTLHVGDSAIMIAPADSLAQYMNGRETLPNDKVYVYLTINQIISKSEISSAEREIMMKQDEEEEQLMQFVLRKYERAEQKPSGLFFLTNYQGSGKKVELGKRVFVNYTVMDTNGKIYDSSIEEVAKKGGIYHPQKAYKPFDFYVGDDALISGWMEGVSYMHVGDRATLIIPSKLAYGDAGMGEIPPYTPLVFEISIVKMTD